MSAETIWWLEVLKIVGAALAGGVATWIGKEWASRRGNRVMVTRVSETPQIRIGRQIGKGDLSIRYNNEDVDNLVVNILRIENNSSHTISPVIIQITAQPTYSSGCKFIKIISIRDPLEKTIISQRDNLLIFEREFLNSAKAYKEEFIEVSIVSDNSITFSVKGGGKAWAIKYQDNEDISYIRRHSLISFGIFSLLSISGIVLINFINLPIDNLAISSILGAAMIIGLFFLADKLRIV